jgi:predicted unusual protein kinase regulating ubiquinone biosynthesis (AarF/ABC1/UbiB family)
LRLLFFFGGLTLHILAWDVGLRALGLGALARRSALSRYRRWARRFCRLATRMGGIWIKVGQFLSARVDVLPQAVTEELAGLQDEVAPIPFSALEPVLDQELGKGWREHFQAWGEEPLASASLGQVHRGRLACGDPVVVKIQRPGIERVIHTDLAALEVVISWLKRFRPVASRADLDALRDEFSRTVWRELDYLAEGANAERFAAMFAHNPGVRVPQVYWQQTTRRVLILEDVFFIKITEYQAIEDAGVDRKEVARRLLHTYLYQIFEEGFFHADPHPGNLFVEPLEDGTWRLVFVDFGMTGELSDALRAGLREVLIGIATRDADRLVCAYQALGVLLPGADLERIRQAEKALLDRFWGRSMRDLTRIHWGEMHEFAKQFRDLLFELPFQVPADLIFLGRCVAILSGMCTGLDPDFNVFEHIVPYARKWLLEDEGDWLDFALDWLESQIRFWGRLPARLEGLLTAVERGELEVRAPALERRLERLERRPRRLGGLLAVALLLGGSALYACGEALLGAALMGAGAMGLIWALFS